MPILRRLYGSIDTPLYDTLVVSRIMYPDKRTHPLGGNSLQCWGEHLQCKKADYSGGWDKYSEDMIKYCEQDTVVAAKIFHAQKSFVSRNSKVISQTSVSRLDYLVWFNTITQFIVLK